MKKDEFIEIYNENKFIRFREDLELLIHNEITIHEIKRVLAIQNKIKRDIGYLK